MEAESCRDREGRIFLRKDGIRAARSRRMGGVAVTCRSGCLWVTWERGGDWILGAGETVRVDGAVLVVIQGMEDSRVEICETGAIEVGWL